MHKLQGPNSLCDSNLHHPAANPAASLTNHGHSKFLLPKTLRPAFHGLRSLRPKVPKFLLELWDDTCAGHRLKIHLTTFSNFPHWFRHFHLLPEVGNLRGTLRHDLPLSPVGEKMAQRSTKRYCCRSVEQEGARKGAARAASFLNRNGYGTGGKCNGG